MRLLFSGYFGFGNTGDEAILQATLTGLSKYIPSAEFSVLSADPESTEAELGVHCADRWSFVRQLAEIYRADLLIQGGGGLYQDTTSRLSPMYYLNQLVIARMLRTPFVIFAQGIGPVRSSFVRGAIIRNFSRAQLLLVRDALSSETLRQWGLSSPEPIVTADPVLTMDPCPQDRTEELLENLQLSNTDYILVALRSWPESEQAYEAICKWLADIERPVLLLPFQYDVDEPVARDVCESVDSDRLRIPDHPHAPREIMGLIEAADIVLAMRLHAMIMSCAVGTPAAGISYDPKVNAFCRRSGQPVMDIRLIERGATSDLIQAARKGFDRVLDQREMLVSEAERNFELVAEICEESL